MMMIPASTSCSRLRRRIQRSVAGASIMASPGNRAAQAVEGEDRAEHDGGQRQHQRAGIAEVEELETDPEAIDVERVRRVAGPSLRRDVDDVEEAQKIDAAQDGGGDDGWQQQRQRNALESLERGSAVDLCSLIDARRQRLQS